MGQVFERNDLNSIMSPRERGGTTGNVVVPIPQSTQQSAAAGSAHAFIRKPKLPAASISIVTLSRHTKAGDISVIPECRAERLARSLADSLNREAAPRHPP
jgi:hypothetical protein